MEAGGGFELWKEAFDGPTLPMILTAVINNGTTAVSTVRLGSPLRSPPRTARAAPPPGRARRAAPARSAALRGHCAPAAAGRRC